MLSFIGKERKPAAHLAGASNTPRSPKYAQRQEKKLQKIMKTPSAVDTYKAVLRDDYCEYVKHVHRGSWKVTPFHYFLCKYVQNFVERETEKPYEILVITTPPQHGKSQSITETLPSWYLGRHPDRHVIEISYNEDFAVKFGRRNRRKIEEYGSEIFDLHLVKDNNRAVEFETTEHGGMI